MADVENLNSVLDLTAKIEHIFQASHMKFGINWGPQIFPKCGNGLEIPSTRRLT
jgi:hypothetical protein